MIQGDHAGNLNPDAALTRAEAFALICRLLSLEPGGDPGYADAEPGDWYYDTASAARAGGLAAEDAYFHPDRLVTRGELTVMAARAMEAAGWLTIPEGGTAAELTLVDAGEIPDWALASYLAFDKQGLGIFTQRSTGETDPVYGEPGVEELAEWDRPATRGEAITLLDNARTRLPWYPAQTAIDWGFDETMPVVDGSTSTYPYTRAVYGALFWNYDNHPQFPESHSKSHESYERLINGEVDALFAATLPSEELKAQAEAAGVELEYIPIAYDAMVFFTNAENCHRADPKANTGHICVREIYELESDRRPGRGAATLPPQHRQRLPRPNGAVFPGGRRALHQPRRAQCPHLLRHVLRPHRCGRGHDHRPPGLRHGL